jgi:hypothetical protein
MDKELMARWRSDPATRAISNVLVEQVESLKDSVAHGNCKDFNDYSRMVGQIAGIESVQDIFKGERDEY